MKSLISWFIDNPIAANALMILICVAGGANLYFSTFGKEVFPIGDLDSIEITAAYLGASPREVEQQVLIRMEEAIADIEGIDEMNALAREGLASITLNIAKGYSTQRIFNTVKTRLDNLNSLPEEVEDIEVRERLVNIALMEIAIYGSSDEHILKETAQWLQQELLSLSSVAAVDIEGTRDREFAIEINEADLKAYGLSFDDIARALRQRSINLPAGTLKTQSGKLQLQSRGQAYSIDEFAAIVIKTSSRGGVLTLGDFATINDGFQEIDLHDNFNGHSASYLSVYTASPPNVVAASEAIQQRLARLNPQLPQGLNVDIWFDWSVMYESRMNLLLDNIFMGLLLVFVVLMLFLRPSLAFWVSIGITTTFLGVFWLLPYTGVTLNLLSMYGFLLALGIVVDDAIVIGESIYANQRALFNQQSSHKAAKIGTLMVSKPVIFAVISTMIFFSVLFGFEDEAKTLAVPIAVVVMLCLTFSLIESLLILPSHLSQVTQVGSTKAPYLLRGLERFRRASADGMERFAKQYFLQFLTISLKNNGLTLLLFALAFLIVLALFLISGYLSKQFSPIIPSSRITMNAVLPEGVSFTETQGIQQQIERAAQQLENDEFLLNINKGKDNFIYAIRSEGRENTVRVQVRLTPSEERTVNILQIKDRWRELVGTLVGVEEFNLRFTINRGSSKDLRFNLTLPGNDHQQLGAAVARVREQLARYQGVYDIEDTLQGSRTEIELRLKPYAELLNISLQDVARQVRQGFYGEEIQRMPRGRDDIKVMLRYTAAERRQLDNVSSMMIRTTTGQEVPITAVAEIVEVPGYTEIRRQDQRRTVAISADLEKGIDSLALANAMITEYLPQWQQQFRGLTVSVAGAVEEEKRFNELLLLNSLLALIASYALMAIVFRSTWQPILTLSAIPFGFMGAIIGHIIMGHPLTMNSLMGVIACAGVVVNDNIVLVDRIDYLRRKGLALPQAIAQAGADRFRAIILTSLTTFVGLFPIMFETSIQAQFLIPTVISLAFGVLFATVVTLIFVPNLYWLIDRCQRFS